MCFLAVAFWVSRMEHLPFHCRRSMRQHRMASFENITCPPLLMHRKITARKGDKNVAQHPQCRDDGGGEEMGKTEMRISLGAVLRGMQHVWY